LAITAAAAAILGAGIAVASAVAYTRLTSDLQQPSLAGPSPFPLPLKRGVTHRGFPSSSERDKRIERIVLTGGPCGGKSSLLKGLIDRLREQGINVFVAPEMPTVLRNDCVCPFPFKPNPRMHGKSLSTPLKDTVSRVAVTWPWLWPPVSVFTAWPPSAPQAASVRMCPASRSRLACHPH